MNGHSIRLCGQEIQPGHICAFFNSRDEEYQTLIPYLKDGIDAGEDVLNVLDASRLQDHHARLEAAGVQVANDRFTISSSEETYLAGGYFDMPRMVDLVRGHVEKAASAGRAVRTAGWMDWMHREAPGTERTMEYEARMNLIAQSFDCTFMCIYDLSKLNGENVIDIMATHPYVILVGRIRENPFFVPPEVYLKDYLESEQKGYSRFSSASQAAPK